MSEGFIEMVWDPKRIYEDRTHPPLREAPRDASTRPVCSTPDDGMTPQEVAIKIQARERQKLTRKNGIRASKRWAREKRKGNR
jgi:hypothetical protein